jgi:SagB-type dehydrogenase family enzyme
MNKLLIVFLIGFHSAWAEVIELPQINKTGKKSLEETIYNRKAIRNYKNESLNLKEVAQLLWSAGGITCDGITGPTRSYPSAGGIYPIEIYLLVGNVEGLDTGVYRYLWRENCLEKIKQGDLRKKLSQACFGQPSILKAPISIIFSANYEKTTKRYGERGKKYVLIDVGHAGENLALQAEALGLGAVEIGAFSEKEAKEVLGIKEKPTYIIPIGRK